jgi:hypothetical protein
MPIHQNVLSVPLHGAFRLTAAIPGAKDGASEGLLRKIASLLNIPPTDAKSIADAVRGLTVETAPEGEPVAAGAKTFSTPHGQVTLSARELVTCKEVGAKPEVYAVNKAKRDSEKKGVCL